MVNCPVCPHHCVLAEGKTGICGARKGENGQSVSISYGEITALALDPIEKKPLARFHPGTRILSVGSFGCNLDCPFCQNFRIAHPDTTVPTIRVQPEELVQRAIAEKINRNIGIAYTYNEPLIGYEFVRDTAALAKAEGLINVVVSNGYTSDFVLDRILPLIDAWNIDLKGSDSFYKKLGGRSEPVLHTIRRAAEMSHVEVTTLLIPGKNDDPKELEPLFDELSQINPDIVLHLSRFFPARNWQHIPPTPLNALYGIKEIAEKYLNTVVLGNV